MAVVETEEHGQILVVRMNRPERLNALSQEMRTCLAGLPHQAELPPLSIGFVSVIGVVLIAPVSSYVAPFGARLAHRLPQRWLEIGFGLFLLLAAARFLASLFG